MKKILLVILTVLVVLVGAFEMGYALRPAPAEVQEKTAGGNTTLSGLQIVPVLSTDTFSVGTASTRLTISGSTGSLYSGGGMTSGGGTRATSTANTTETLLASDISPFNLIVVTPTLQTVTETLPASSTLPTNFLPNTGDSSTMYLYNGTTTAGVNVTVAFGTGCKGSIATSTAATTVTLGPTKGASIELIRLPTTDLACIITPGV